MVLNLGYCAQRTHALSWRVSAVRGVWARLESEVGFYLRLKREHPKTGTAAYIK